MASCDWKKIKTANEAKAMFRHSDSSKRVELEHSNLQIDKSKTHLNLEFGAFKSSYKHICNAYDARIAELDSMPGANKRKDRVTLVGWTVPVPDNMDEKTSRKWLADVYRIMKERYGNSLLGGSAHFDEIHEYTDAETGAKRESRPHLHMYAFPIVDDRLNAKSFMSRRNMVAVNNAIEDMTQHLYPQFKFQNGTKKKSTKSVEQLKNESAEREAREQAQKQAQSIIEQARETAQRILNDANRKSDEIYQDAEKAAQKRSDELQKALDDVDEARKKYVYASSALETASRADNASNQESYMKTFMVQGSNGSIESVYDRYMRDVVEPKIKAAKEAERAAQEAEERAKRRLPDVPFLNNSYGTTSHKKDTGREPRRLPDTSFMEQYGDEEEESYPF